MNRALTILVTAFTLAFAPTARAGGQSCKVASDCKGMVPRVCRKCDDGTNQCAHHVCNNGTCEIATCPLTAGGGGSGTGSGTGTGGTSTPECKVASDCKGILSKHCVKCADGKDDCEHWTCNAGACMKEMCGASNAGSGGGGPPKPQCTKATDCRGMLPHLCQKCPDGRQDCAHWACNKGTCEQEICPLTSPAPKPAPK
jgi:hypothetical protein